MTGLFRCLFAGALALCALVPAGADAQTMTRPRYGCYKVVGADALNIRARPFSSSEIIGTASRDEILVKWRRWCTLRGFWCPVQLGEIKGHSDKRYLEPTPCPQSLSAPADF